MEMGIDLNNNIPTLKDELDLSPSSFHNSPGITRGATAGKAHIGKNGKHEGTRDECP
jgi:hypothetical protein